MKIKFKQERLHDKLKNLYKGWHAAPYEIYLLYVIKRLEKRIETLEKHLEEKEVLK